jgi:hypothetical protein
MLRVLVCGGRHYNDRDALFKYLDKTLVGGEVAICHGGASGADALADAWAKARGVPCTPYPANWKKYGRRAGPIRNQRMLDDFDPALVIAFPGGRGTADMISKAQDHGVTVFDLTSTELKEEP